jgi:hypothetical protein
VFRMTSFPMCLKILRFCFGTARAKLDEWERVENRTCKNAATTSASVSCSSSGTVTLGVPYSSDYLSRFVSVDRSRESCAAHASDDDHRK